MKIERMRPEKIHRTVQETDWFHRKHKLLQTNYKGKIRMLPFINPVIECNRLQDTDFITIILHREDIKYINLEESENMFITKKMETILN